MHKAEEAHLKSLSRRLAARLKSAAEVLDALNGAPLDGIPVDIIVPTFNETAKFLEASATTIVDGISKLREIENSLREK